MARYSVPLRVPRKNASRSKGSALWESFQEIIPAIMKLAKITTTPPNLVSIRSMRKLQSVMDCEIGLVTAIGLCTGGNVDIWYQPIADDKSMTNGKKDKRNR